MSLIPIKVDKGMRRWQNRLSWCFQMEREKLVRAAGSVGAVAGAVAIAIAGYMHLRPIDKIGPFDQEKRAYIRSEDGKYTVSQLQIADGMLTEWAQGKEVFKGKITRIDKGGFKVVPSAGASLSCLTASDSQAVCGAIRFQKPLGRFQFDRKVPYSVQENVFRGMLSASGRENKTIMFKSEDGSLWIKSAKAGSYTFTGPDKFRINWKDRGIRYDTGTYADELIERSADCVINTSLKDASVICNGKPMNGSFGNYSSIWTFVDDGDAAESLGAKPEGRVMDSHD